MREVDRRADGLRSICTGSGSYSFGRTGFLLLLAALSSLAATALAAPEREALATGATPIEVAVLPLELEESPELYAPPALDAPAALDATSGSEASGESQTRAGQSRFGSETARSVAEFDFSLLPGRLAEPSLRPLWLQGLELERREDLLESAAFYEKIVREVPEESFTYWRIARNYWRHGESLPTEDKLRRTQHFEWSEHWAGRGIEVDPECAPCMLWKFVAMGRQATTNGLITAMSDVDEMDELLRRGIELKPAYADNAGNATLGNLYYSGAVFYRVIPDWFWLRWLIGMRGDKERSLEYARRAVEISEIRVDYRVELGAALLCLGTDKNRPQAIAEGIEVLHSAVGMPHYLSTDHLDLEHAEILIQHPAKACGYSRDGFLDLDQVLADSQLED